MTNQVYVAKLGKTVGLNGQLKLYIDSDFPEQFSKNTTFTTNKKTTLTIESFNAKSNIVKFIGIDSIDDAKKLTNQQLFVSLEDTKNICKLEENQYFWFDLIGCEIIEDGENLGKIADIQRFPQCDYFEVDTNNILVEEKSLAKRFLLPYIPEYIASVDISSKTITTNGALDILYAS